jgi:hypothetical protein
MLDLLGIWFAGKGCMRWMMEGKNCNSGERDEAFYVFSSTTVMTAMMAMRC